MIYSKSSCSSSASLMRMTRKMIETAKGIIVTDARVTDIAASDGDKSSKSEKVLMFAIE